MITALLKDLLLDMTSAEVDPSIECSGLQLDSRLVKPNDLFAANVGGDARADSFARQALEAGAAAVLIDASAQLGDDLTDISTVVAIPNLAQKVGLIAARHYDHPSHNMLVVGVTGTNGKTSCCVMQAQLMSLLDVKSNYIGTLGAGSLDDLVSTGFTTPPADILQKFLYRAYSQSVRAVALEVSSHALDQHRIAATKVDVAVFTNLSRDHLDFHGSMQNYAATKARLFTQEGLQAAVINVDDNYGLSLAKQLPHGVRLVRVSLQSSDAEFYLSEIAVAEVGFTARLHSPDGEFSLTTPLLGEFNLYNLLLVCAASYAAGYAMQSVVPKLSVLEAPKGRMQLVEKRRPQVIVDYAHTPDALAKACDAVRSHCVGRLILVFGCGGDRDIGKRPEMGAIAAEYADIVMLTNDNPRSERPAEIVEQILLGIPLGTLVVVELDRHAAIVAAIKEAKPEDCVLIAGKGHELYQEIAGERIPFTDVQEARTALAGVAA